MIDALEWVFGALIIVTCFLSALYSFRSRRTRDGRLRGLYASRMNISMGLMLIFIAALLMIVFTGSSVKVVVGALFILLGLFNLFAGLRNHSHFARLQQ
jgi:formate hydrogenlyase subunit 3/multisubunit Na+/H+ antiporter MnhD subunit